MMQRKRDEPQLIAEISEFVQAISGLSDALAIKTKLRIREMEALPPEEAVQVTLQPQAGADQVSMTAAQALILVRELVMLSPEEAAQATAQAQGRADQIGMITAKVIWLATALSYPVDDLAILSIALIQDLAILPLDMASQAVILGGEITFPADVAHSVFDYLATQGCAVFGLEAWRRKGNNPSWIATMSTPT